MVKQNGFDANKFSRFRTQLQSEQCSFGAWVTLSDSKVSEIYARAGFDWVLVDLEHSALTIHDAECHLRVLNLAGTISLSRPTFRSVDQIRRLLDAGTDGFILPKFHGLEDMKFLLDAAFFPIGSRGMGLHSANSFGRYFDEYLALHKQGPIVIAQIEDMEGVDRIEEVADHPNLDGIFLGPYDLSLSLNCAGDFDHPKFKNAVSIVKAIAKKYKKPLGMHVILPETEAVKKVISEGYAFAACSLDTKIINDVCSSLICDRS